MSVLRKQRRVKVGLRPIEGDSCVWVGECLLLDGKFRGEDWWSVKEGWNVDEIPGAARFGGISMRVSFQGKMVSFFL